MREELVNIALSTKFNNVYRHKSHICTGKLIKVSLAWHIAVNGQLHGLNPYYWKYE